jgi:hypothetical protein
LLYNKSSLLVNPLTIFVMDNNLMYAIEALIVAVPVFMIVRTFVLRGRKLLD